MAASWRPGTLCGKVALRSACADGFLSLDRHDAMKLSALRAFLKNKGLRPKRTETISVSGFTMEVYPETDDFKKVDPVVGEIATIDGKRKFVVMDDLIDEEAMSPQKRASALAWFKEVMVSRLKR